MPDKRVVYTCALWDDAQDLDEAQEAKLDIVCRKLKLQRGDRILDVGCGWGSFAKYAAEKYDVHVTGVTLSKNQSECAENKHKGLMGGIRLTVYRHCS